MSVSAEEVMEKKITTTMYIPQWMYWKLEKISRERKVPKTEIVREALQLYFDLCEAGMLGDVKALLEKRGKGVSGGG